MSVGADAAKVLNAAAKQIGKLPDTDIDALLAGEGELRFVPPDLLPAVKMVLALTEEQRRLLATKEASVKFVPPGHRVAPTEKPTRQASKKAASPDADEVREHLGSVGSEADAHDYLASLRLNAPGTRELAKQLGVPLQAKASADDAVEGIVKVFVRSRLSAEAIRRY